MCSADGIGLGLSVLGGVAQGQAAREQGYEARDIANYNAGLLDTEARLIRSTGKEQEHAMVGEIQRMQSRQITQQAASGVDIRGQTAQQLRDETAIMGAADIMRVRSNYERQAWAKEQEAYLTRRKGAAAAKAGEASFFGSLLGGAGSVASKWNTL